MMAARTGVLLMAYGAARDLDDLERYYTHIRHGRPPMPEELADLRRRYRAIGGRSPLDAITREEGERLEAALNRNAGESRFRVYLGMKHSPPFIAEASATMVADGVDRVVGLVLAPHYSAMSVGQYLSEAEKALAEAGGSRPPEFYPVRSWHREPLFLDLIADRVRAALTRFTPDEQKGLAIVFTAHSLPERIRAENDPYPEQIRETGELVMARLALPGRERYGWQSRGRTREPWLGPDILEMLEELRAEGTRAVLVVPIGFVSDHLEILYDLDIQAERRARDLGLHLERTESLNADPRFIAALVRIVGETLRPSEAH